MWLKQNEVRGTGKTHNQIINAKKNALFIVYDVYALKDILARLHELDRKDIRAFTGEQAFANEGHNLAGLTFSEVIVDHAIQLNDAELNSLQYLKSLCRWPADTK